MILWKKVILGLILAVVYGIYCSDYVSYIKPIGDIFLRMIQMIIAPLIFFSLVTGITSMSNRTSLSRVGMKAVIAFLSTTVFAVMLGIITALILKPGNNIQINFNQSQNTIKTQSFCIIDFLVNIIPRNIIESFSNNYILQIVFLAIFTGYTINKMGENATRIKDAFHLISTMILKMISIVVQFSPYGSFALMAWVIGTQGVDAMISLSKLVVTILIAMTCQYFIFGIFIYLFCQMSPLPFYKKSLEYQILAISTASTKATLATTMNVCRERLGISESSTSFLLPLGASINMDGLAIGLSLTTIFLAQIMGVTLELQDYLVIIITATLGSIGGAGIPGGALIMLPMVLSSINLPIEGVAIVAGIDRIVDMLRTVISITGDATITLIIDHSEGTLDKEKYLK